MIDHFFLFVPAFYLLDDNPVFAYLEQAPLGLRSVLHDKFHLAADVLPVLAVQLQRLVETGRGYFQRKIPVRKKGGFFEFFVQGPVKLDAFFDGDTLVAVDKHLYIIGRLNLYVYQKVTRFGGNDILQQPFYSFDCFVDHIKLKKGTLPFPSPDSLTIANVG